MVYAITSVVNETVSHFPGQIVTLQCRVRIVQPNKHFEINMIMFITVFVHRVLKEDLLITV